MTKLKYTFFISAFLLVSCIPFVSLAADVTNCQSDAQCANNTPITGGVWVCPFASDPATRMCAREMFLCQIDADCANNPPVAGAPSASTWSCSPGGNCVFTSIGPPLPPANPAPDGAQSCTVSANCPDGYKYCADPDGDQRLYCYQQCITINGANPVRSNCPSGWTCRGSASTPQVGDTDGYCDDNAPGSAPPDTTPAPASATPSTPIGDIKLINALQATSFEGLITDILDGVVQLGAILLVLALVWVGFLFTTAQGKEESIKKAREALFWCVVGGLMLLGASAISLAIKGFVEAL